MLVKLSLVANMCFNAIFLIIFQLAVIPSILLNISFGTMKTKIKATVKKIEVDIRTNKPR